MSLCAVTRAIAGRLVQLVVVAALVASCAACTRPTAIARTTPDEPPSQAEREAEARLAGRSCSSQWGLLFPGIGHLCTGQRREGAAMVAVGAAELGAAIVAATRVEAEPGESVLAHPAVALPLLGFQQAYLYAAADLAIMNDRAARKRFAPLDSTADLAAAPFNLEVMKRPEIWLGLTAAVAAVVGVSFLIDDEIAVSNIGNDANVFGKRLPFAAGYPLALGTFAGLDLQVAMGEEALFRGVIQSGLARRFGETEGLLAGSLLFGLLHVPSGLGLEGEERRNFYLYKLPATVAAGTYFSWLYKRSGYSLAPSTAMHFWHNFLLSAAFFALRPDESPLSVSFEMRF
jgi:membrane protease YdiL (CAAX protease family)